MKTPQSNDDVIVINRKDLRRFSAMGHQKRWSFFNADGTKKSDEEIRQIMEARKRQGQYLTKGKAKKMAADDGSKAA